MRALGLVLFAACAVWVSLLVDVGASHGPDPAIDAMLVARAVQTETVAPAPASRVHQASGTEAEGPGRVFGRIGVVWSSEQAADVVPGPVRAAPLPAFGPAHGEPRGKGAAAWPTGELGEGALSPDFRDLSQQYSRESRDFAWASQTEAQVAALFTDPKLARQVVLLNCQSQTCRLVLEGTDSEQVEQLFYLPGLRQLTGLGPGSPYSLRAGELSLYFRRGAHPARTAAVAEPTQSAR